MCKVAGSQPAVEDAATRMGCGQDTVRRHVRRAVHSRVEVSNATDPPHKISDTTRRRHRPRIVRYCLAGSLPQSFVRAPPCPLAPRHGTTRAWLVTTMSMRSPLRTPSGCVGQAAMQRPCVSQPGVEAPWTGSHAISAASGCLSGAATVENRALLAGEADVYPAGRPHFKLLGGGPLSPHSGP